MSPSTQNNINFIFMDVEKFCVDFNKDAFEQLMRLLTRTPAIHLSGNIPSNKGYVCFNISNPLSTYALGVIINGSPIYYVIFRPKDKTNSYRHERLQIPNESINEIVTNGFAKSVFRELNDVLNKYFNEFNMLPEEPTSVTNEKVQNSENKNTENKITENKTPEVKETLSIKPAYNPNKLYVKKSKEQVVLDNIEIIISNEHRQIVARFGKTRTNIKRLCDLIGGKISVIVFRKNKTKSVLRHDRTDKNKFVLKIGTGPVLTTKNSEIFEWRVPHTEENIKHIESAFIEFNKWVEEKKEIIKQEKEQEESIGELLQKEDFIELK